MCVSTIGKSHWRIGSLEHGNWRDTTLPVLGAYVIADIARAIVPTDWFKNGGWVLQGFVKSCQTRLIQV